MAELAWCYHWPPSELDNLPMDELMVWHQQAMRIQQLINKAP